MESGTLDTNGKKVVVAGEAHSLQLESPSINIYLLPIHSLSLLTACLSTGQIRLLCQYDLPIVYELQAIAHSAWCTVLVHQAERLLFILMSKHIDKSADWTLEHIRAHPKTLKMTKLVPVILHQGSQQYSMR